MAVLFLSKGRWRYMANRITDKQRKRIIADYVELGSYNAVAKKHKISDKTVKRIVTNDDGFMKKAEQKKEQNSADILEYMENQKGVVCEIIGKCLTILNDEEKLAKAQPQQITTAMGTLIDKFVNMTPADKEDKEIHVVISRAGEESDDK